MIQNWICFLVCGRVKSWKITKFFLMKKQLLVDTKNRFDKLGQAGQAWFWAKCTCTADPKCYFYRKFSINFWQLTWMKLAVVINFEAPSTSFHNATFLSGIFHNLNFPSKLPDKKNWSFLGWKQIAVTKSICWKQQRHSRLEICHNRTVLSMLEVRIK